MLVQPITDSRMISKLEFDPATGDLFVTYRSNRKRYRHAGVSPETYEAVRTADSVGQMFALMRKGGQIGPGELVDPMAEENDSQASG